MAALFEDWAFDDSTAGEAEAAAAYVPSDEKYYDENVITPEMTRAAQYEGEYGPNASVSESNLPGTRNSLALVSDTPQNGGFSGLQKLLGSVGQTARDIGSLVGTIEKEASGAKTQYQTARTNAKAGNKVQQWIQYSSTTDKLTVGIGVLGLLYLVLKK